MHDLNNNIFAQPTRCMARIYRRWAFHPLPSFRPISDDTYLYHIITVIIASFRDISRTDNTLAYCIHRWSQTKCGGCDTISYHKYIFIRIQWTRHYHIYYVFLFQELNKKSRRIHDIVSYRQSIFAQYCTRCSRYIRRD